MNRRDFLKLSILSAFAAAAIPFSKVLFKKQEITKPASDQSLYYPLRGNSFDNAADVESHYNHMPFYHMADDIERYRMPRKWTEAKLLGLHQEDFIS
ncbi:MAG: hypothetical protein QF845_02670 [Candidatus Marinimicrobia bacterium]|jgi:hypothetical protein|nr:hypothetical protein [Candidatus Neomarinimicrobiota bacterium]MDP6789419.1 hypothetical protein [Candidatus Neomarinimicrobiota bacterium]MDP7071569.1 hypothetical protein [Candidatus Neomarinimicrobiota bacterium]